MFGRHVWPGMKELARNLHAQNWSKRTNAGGAGDSNGDGDVRIRACGLADGWTVLHVLAKSTERARH